MSIYKVTWSGAWSPLLEGDNPCVTFPVKVYRRCVKNFASIAPMAFQRWYAIATCFTRFTDAVTVRKRNMLRGERFI